MGTLIRLLGSAFFLFTLTRAAQAKAPPPLHSAGVPEIDASFAPGAIALLVCGVLMLVGRFSKHSSKRR